MKKQKMCRNEIKNLLYYAGLYHDVLGKWKPAWYDSLAKCISKKKHQTNFAVNTIDFLAVATKKLDRA